MISGTKNGFFIQLDYSVSIGLDNSSIVLCIDSGGVWDSLKMG
jgi:hypothetical protein